MIQWKTLLALRGGRVHVRDAPARRPHSITQPNTPDTSTERTMPRGTLRGRADRLLRRVGRGVEAGDRVGRQQEAQGEQPGEAVGRAARRRSPGGPL